MFGINGGEALVLLVVALVVIGPERLPHYAEQLAHQIRNLRGYLQGAKERVRSELGEDDETDWTAFDPRQYDPRRIVREALVDPVMDAVTDPASPRPRAAARTAGAAAAAGVATAAAPQATPGAAPFDDEAT